MVTKTASSGASSEPGRTARTGSAPFRVEPADGFEVFDAEHRDAVARTLAFAFNDRELGFEAADEAMVRAYRDWAKVSTYGNPEGWVYRVGLNWGRSSLRRKMTATMRRVTALRYDWFQ